MNIIAMLVVLIALVELSNLILALLPNIEGTIKSAKNAGMADGSYCLAYGSAMAGRTPRACSWEPKQYSTNSSPILI